MQWLLQCKTQARFWERPKRPGYKMLVLQEFYLKIYSVLCLLVVLCELCSGKTPCDYAHQYPLPLPSWNSGDNPLKGMTSNSNISERQESIVRGSSVSFTVLSPLILIFYFHSIRVKPASATPPVSHHRFFCSFAKWIFCLALSAAWKVTLIQQRSWAPLLTETRVYYFVQNSNSRLWDFFLM